MFDVKRVSCNLLYTSSVQFSICRRIYSTVYILEEKGTERNAL